MAKDTPGKRSPAAQVDALLEKAAAAEARGDLGRAETLFQMALFLEATFRPDVHKRTAYIASVGPLYPRENATQQRGGNDECFRRPVLGGRDGRVVPLQGWGTGGQAVCRGLIVPLRATARLRNDARQTGNRARENVAEHLLTATELEAGPQNVSAFGGTYETSNPAGRPAGGGAAMGITPAAT